MKAERHIALNIKNDTQIFIRIKNTNYSFNTVMESVLSMVTHSNSRQEYQI